jgi:hypothetical protein
MASNLPEIMLSFAKKKFGLNITVGEILTFNPTETYDHIRLHHVVEHLRNPVLKLRRAASWLNQGGTIYVEVPDFERYCKVKTPGRIFHYGHIYNFDRDSFSYLVHAAGLQIVERTGPTSAFLTHASPEQSQHSQHETTWDIPSKIAFYQLHKSGKLKTKSRIEKWWKKLAKAWRGQKIIQENGTHTHIGTHISKMLKQALDQ